MKFCAKCGQEINSEAVVCVHCGCATKGGTSSEDKPSFLWSLLGFWQPLIGFILFAIWNTEKPLTAKCCLKGAIASFILGAVFFVIYIIFIVVVMVALPDTYYQAF